MTLRKLIKNNMSDKEIIFTDGLQFWLPRPGAPEYVRGQLSIDPKKFVEFMNSHKDYMRSYTDREGNERKQFSIDLKIGQSGKAYAALNTYQKPSE